MNIIEKIKAFFTQREEAKDADKAIAAVEAAAKSNNYNQASIKAFHALEAIGEVYADQKRQQHETAREYAKKLVDEGLTTDDDLEPILVSFELAKYSENQVTFDDYSKVESSLDAVAKKFKSGKAKPKKTKKGRRRRRRPRKGGKTGAAKSRRTRKSGGSDS